MIDRMIHLLNNEMLSWVKENSSGYLEFVDPLDGQEISAHYGATHVATAWVIYGKKTNDQELLSLGLSLIDSITSRWKVSMGLPSYHYDFNNFALCLAFDSIDDTTLKNRIKETVLHTQDSNNPTINWYPMRWYVNHCRYIWTGQKKYKEVCDACQKGIKDATYQDGFIDDRQPKGRSFNLQYDIATVAVMQLLRTKGIEIDISKEVAALLNVVSPDGDINYLGRGTNQVFAWGLWIYLLVTSCREEAKTAINYLWARLPIMLDNKNIMLNSIEGEAKYLWWDYHYYSVYMAHLLLWLVLSLGEKAKVEPTLAQPRDSGIRIHQSVKSKVVVFEGRSEYLSEKGPSISLLWTKRDGVIIKGSFGPWQGMFGNQHSIPDVVLRNYCGLLSLKQNKDFSKNRFARKFLHELRIHESESVKPLFVPIKIEETDGRLIIRWILKSSEMFIVNLPMLHGCTFECNVNGRSVDMINGIKLKNQYGWIDLWQSGIVTGNQVELSIAI